MGETGHSYGAKNYIKKFGEVFKVKPPRFED